MDEMQKYRLRIIAFCVAMLAVAMIPLAHADTIDSVYVITQETNNKVSSLVAQQANATTAITALTQRVANTEYAVNSLSQDYVLTLIISCIFTAFLTTFVVNKYVANKISDGIRTLQPVPAPAPTVVPEVVQPEYDVLTVYVCRKCKQPYTESVKFCPVDGTPVKPHSEKVPRAIMDRANAQAAVTERKATRSWWRRHLPV